MTEALSLKIPKKHAREALALTRQLALLNQELKLARETDFIHIPLSREPLSDQLEELRRSLPQLEVARRDFAENPRKHVKLVDVLSKRLPPHLLASLPHAIDFIGDIAVVEIPPELEPYKRTIGEAILTTHRKMKTVLSKWSPVGGVYRLRTFEAIAGETRTQTVHKEHGCVFFVDLAKAYFTPRLSYEHSRVAMLVREGETVIDLFAGVGPFSIHIARTHKAVRVYAIDLNPDAYSLLNKNILVNRVEGKVTPILGDAKEAVDGKLTGIADRIIMNLPEKAIEYVDTVCKALKPTGGVIHYYQFSDMPEPTESAKTRLAEAVRQTGRRLTKIQSARIVRGIAPFTYQVAVDAEIK